jgi:hypothetical protein
VVSLPPSTERLLGALTPYGRIIWTQNRLYDPALIIETRDGIKLLVLRRDLRGVRVVPREERVPVKSEDAGSWYGTLEGVAITTPESAQEWLEPVMRGTA